ncbi:MAG TPA: glycosyltransferase family A protein [Devosia sp.]|nr:glycosyltransferase family A protein [Devosia sp.]
MKLAVIMPAFNAELYVASALDSLLRQRDAAELDIIVVDDGSTDGTGDIVRSIAREAPEVRLIEQPNRGIARARNAGLDALAPETEVLTFLDADDLSPPGRFRRDLAHFGAEPALEFHYGFLSVFRSTTSPMEPAPLERPLETRGIQLGAMLMRTALQKRIGYFDGDFEHGEDVDYIFRIIESQPRLMLVEDICVYYRRHPGNISRALDGTRTGTARAILKSHIRRKKTGAPSVPPGFFDGSRMGENPEWY